MDLAHRVNVYQYMNIQKRTNSILCLWYPLFVFTLSRCVSSGAIWKLTIANKIINNKLSNSINFHRQTIVGLVEPIITLVTYIDSIE